MAALNQKEFAKHVGLSPSRVRQLLAIGLPANADGKIDAAKGKEWIDNNLDPKRRDAAKPGFDSSKLGAMARMRAFKMGVESRLLQIELKRAEGDSLDRAEVEAAAFGRARYERDAWHGFTARAAVTLAGELSCDPQKTHAALDRLIREHLKELAATPWNLS